MGGYLKKYLDTLRIRGDIDIAESVEETANKFAEKYLDTFTFVDHEAGLLFGNVQAGKTGQMFGILCAAADRSFPIFVVFTTDNVTLQKQTYERLEKDLAECDFCICDESDIQKFIDNALVKPAVIVLKKNSKVLLQWNNALASSDFVRGNALFVIDDEADAASLNTLVNSNRVSTINKRIKSIRDASIGSIYLQVTGTPQAILLQTHISGFRPAFTTFFEPGEKYLGGDYFFGDNHQPIRYIDHLEDRFGSHDLEDEKEALYEAFIHHLVASSYLRLDEKKVCNFVIHPGVRKAAHEKIKKEILQIIEVCKEEILQGTFEDGIKKEYENASPQYCSSRSFDDILNECKKLIQEDLISIVVMNGNHAIDEKEYREGFNVVIGGNILGRGVTFPKLQTLYYTRTAKKPQADTMWQHSRMFGYDRDPGLMAVFITEHLYKLFMDINAGNNSMIKQIEKGLDNIQIIYPEGLNPTRKNVIDQRAISFLTGGTNYYPDNLRNDSVEQLTDLLSGFFDKEYSQVGLVFLQQILSHVIPTDDFDVDGFMGAIKAQIATNPSAQGILIIRRNRQVTQGTGSLLSPNDRTLGESFTDKTVLTMYQISGNCGWEQENVWVPNIKLPENINYFNS